jgi:hypothetical protein
MKHFIFKYILWSKYDFYFYDGFRYDRRYDQHGWRTLGAEEIIRDFERMVERVRNDR